MFFELEILYINSIMLKYEKKEANYQVIKFEKMNV